MSHSDRSRFDRAKLESVVDAASHACSAGCACDEVISAGQSFQKRSGIDRIQRRLHAWSPRCSQVALNPVYCRTLLEGLTQKITSSQAQPRRAGWDAASTTIPISLRSNRERSLWDPCLNGMGVTARRYSDVDDASSSPAMERQNAIPGARVYLRS